jgi:hypothetical protein
LDSKKIDYEKSDFWEKLLTGKKIGEWEKNLTQLHKELVWNDGKGLSKISSIDDLIKKLNWLADTKKAPKAQKTASKKTAKNQ